MENQSTEPVKIILTELLEIYRKEGGVAFLPGISAVIEAISECRDMDAITLIEDRFQTMRFLRRPI